MVNDERPGTILSSEDSWRVLERNQHGRLAVSVLGAPDIFPINFLAHDNRLLFRTNPGTKLAELTVNNRVAFEVDEINDTEARSVVVKGVARVIDTQSEVDVVDQLPLKPWTGTRKYTYVEIVPTAVHGRHYELGGEPDRY